MKLRLTNFKFVPNLPNNEAVCSRTIWPSSESAFGQNNILGRFHTFIGHESPWGGKRYSSTLPRTSAPEGSGGPAPRPDRLYPRERPGTHFTGGWVGPRAGPERRKISSPLGFDPGPSIPVVRRYTD